MKLIEWWRHPCRFGHKWIYVRGIWSPFLGWLGENTWRGCVRCHADQVIGHSSAAGDILEEHWAGAPNLRVYEEWRSLCHPSGWTRKWYTPPEMSEEEWGSRGGWVSRYPSYA